MKNDSNLHIRLPKEDKLIILAEAQRQRLSLSAFVRNKIFRNYVEV
tara:strand:- start:102 stop:239 length:138 start_codon:yes stop_codon:yes gene_type:complete